MKDYCGTQLKDALELGATHFGTAYGSNYFFKFLGGGRYYLNNVMNWLLDLNPNSPPNSELTELNKADVKQEALLTEETPELTDFGYTPKLRPTEMLSDLKLSQEQVSEKSDLLIDALSKPNEHESYACVEQEFINWADNLDDEVTPLPINLLLNLYTKMKNDLIERELHKSKVMVEIAANLRSKAKRKGESE